MANCSIPNFNPATGPISTPSSPRSRNLNSASKGFFLALGLTIAAGSWMLKLFNAQRPTFALFRRVKGAWWPSRSSKPLSVRKSRGRFDSCPLRLLISDFRLPIFDCCSHRPVGGNSTFDRRFSLQLVAPFFQSKIEIRNFTKGGEHSCRASRFEN
jgi:hypothetical protein